MTSYVALLRGIAPTNPLMRNAALRSVFEQAGLDHVRTVISSGNVIFESPSGNRDALEDLIEVTLEEHLGAPCTTIVRSQRQIALMAALDVFDAYDDDSPTQRCNVTFLKRARSGSSIDLDGEPGAEVVAVRNQAVFTVLDTTSTATPRLMRRLDRVCGPEITMRTWRTVHRIRAAFDTSVTPVP